MDSQAIEDLVHGYCYHFDLNEPEKVAGLFTEDARVDYGPESEIIVGADEIARVIAVGLERTFIATSHHVSNLQLSFEGSNTARGVAYLYAWHRYVDGSPDGELWGRYTYDFLRVPEGWRIAKLALRAAGMSNFHRAKMHPIGRRPIA